MSKASAKSNFKKAVAKAKQLYKSGRYPTFADAVKAAYKGAKVSGTTKRKPAARKKTAKRKKSHKTWGTVQKHERRVSGISGASASTLRSELVSRKKDALGKQLLRREMATRKTDKRKISKLIRATKADIKKLS